MHSLLKRQLERLGLTPEAAPEAAGWKLMLQRVAQSYLQADQNRELVERSMALSSEEMRALNLKLQDANRALEARVVERTAELLEERERTTKSLYFSQVLHRLRDVETADTNELLRTATEIAAHALKVVSASVWMFNTERTALVCRDLFRADAALHEHGARCEERDFPRYFRALANEDVLDADDLVTDPRTHELAAGPLGSEGITATLDAPLRLGSHIEGAVCFGHSGSARRWTCEEKAFAQAHAGIVMHAITEEARRAAEATVHESEARFRSLNALSSDWYWEQDAELRMSMVSDNYASLSGSTPARALGRRRWEETNRQPLTGTWDDHRAVLEARQPFRDFETVRIAENGEHHYISLSGDPVFDGVGVFKGYRGVSKNISERKRAELAVKESRDAAQAANRAKSDFLANMSHEIRTPMNAVIGLSELLLLRDNDPEQRDYLQKIDTAAKSLLRIINDILDISKIEAGKLEIENVDFDLYRLLDEVTMMTSMRARAKGLQFVVQSDADFPGELIGDPVRLAQVISNLCGNAIKFTSQGRVTLAVQRVAPDNGEAYVLFTVSDTGIGIATQEQGKLFQPFAQADSSTTRRFGGTGLGLAISRQLVELMGGHIEVVSTPGQGSTFRFTLPFRPAQKPPPVPHTQVIALHGKRILLIDDDEEFLDFTQKRVRGWKLAATTTCDAQHGIETLAKAAQGGSAFDFVLLDWKMPGIDGIKASALIRADARIVLQPKILLVTAFRDKWLEGQAANAKIDGLLLKPFSASTLFEALMRVALPTLATASTGTTATAAPMGEVEKLPAAPRGMRILLVEDNSVNQMVALAMLNKMGMHTTLANNGREAVDLIVVGRFDAVLMDMHMPEMDGVEATRLVRQDPALQTLPIIAITASAMAGDREMMLAAGMNDYIAKPVTLANLHSTLAKWTPVARE